MTPLVLPLPFDFHSSLVWGHHLTLVWMDLSDESTFSIAPYHYQYRFNLSRAPLHIGQAQAIPVLIQQKKKPGEQGQLTGAGAVR